jgi:hypothetical protein
MASYEEPGGARVELPPQYNPEDPMKQIQPANNCYM